LTHLYLIRHGEAWGAVHRRIADQVGEAGLSPLGIRQAERLRDRLRATREIAADVLIASTFPRAAQTAAIIAPAWGLPVIPDDEVQELRPGESDGLPWEEAAARFGKVDFDVEPFRPVAPGGDSWQGFLLRVGAALHRIAREHAGKRVVIVCHGGVIDSTFYHFFGMSPLARARFDFYTHNTSITHWEQHESGGKPRWRLHRYNDDTHLRDHIEWTRVSPPQDGADAPSLPLPTESRGGER
jgi:2,3-bisphosphoglycerate-dependent phosphoglycerate mutase